MKEDLGMAATANVPSKRFLDMTVFEKLQFLSKLVVFFLTFGFVFPKILSQ